MTEETRTTLLELSRQLWDIHSSLICYEDYLAECLKEDYLVNKEYLEDGEETIEFGIELLEDICSAKKNAIKIFKSSAQQASCLLDDLSNCLEKALREFQLKRQLRQLGELHNHPEDGSRKTLLEDIFRTDVDWFAAIEEMAQKTAGEYAQFESEQSETEITSDDNEKILPERKSAPLSLTQMATYWGGQMTPIKLRSMIKNGHIKVERINRQTFVFDIEKLPDYVKDKVRK
ncbi:MAG: hypothetical protein ACYSR8_04150 [Planctomycetota bacterium]|jgi:hypothetical protein